MAMQYVHHNTPDQAERYIAEAVEIVERLDVPDDLRDSAFVKAVDLLSNKLAYGQPDVIPTGAIQLGGVG